MSIALVISVLSMAAAALVKIECFTVWILAEFITWSMTHGHVSSHDHFLANSQYFLVGVAEILFFIGQLEFFYDQSPDPMHSLCSAVSLLATSL
jgi:peptide/histidine transporter 3/4